MKKLLTTTLILLFFLSQSLPAQENSDAYDKGMGAITQEAVKGQLEFLASDWTEGRETGEPGAFLASDYIASIFSVLGIAPGGDTKWHYPPWRERMAGARPTEYRTYFQEITMIKYKPGPEQHFMLTSGNRSISFAFETDFSLNSGSIAQEIDADLVFIGYGYVNEDEKYDDYKGIDVEGKVVVRLAGYPGHSDTSSDAYKKFHPEGRYAEYYMGRDKNNIAEEKGVAGIIEVYPGRDRSTGWIKNVPFRYNGDYYEGEESPETREYSYDIPEDTLSISPVRIYLSKRAANEIFAGTGIDTKAWEEQVKIKMKPASQILAGKKVYIKTSVESELIKARNVVGMIPGKDTTGAALVVGAHYDHIGIHNGYIWNGADDNASGTVGVMTVAKACMATGKQPDKTIYFAAWTGEEKGLLGSAYFVDNPPVPLENINFYLNYDMISRDDEKDSLKNKCEMTYTAGQTKVEDDTKAFVEKYNINLDISMDPTTSKGGGSDHSPFARKDIPFFYFMAGFHDEYHTPKDEVDKVNYQKMTDIIKVGFLNIWNMAN